MIRKLPEEHHRQTDPARNAILGSTPARNALCCHKLNSLYVILYQTQPTQRFLMLGVFTTEKALYKCIARRTQSLKLEEQFHVIGRKGVFPALSRHWPHNNHDRYVMFAWFFFQNVIECKFGPMGKDYTPKLRCDTDVGDSTANHLRFIYMFTPLFTFHSKSILPLTFANFTQSKETNLAWPITFCLSPWVTKKNPGKFRNVCCFCLRHVTPNNKHVKRFYLEFCDLSVSFVNVCDLYGPI